MAEYMTTDTELTSIANAIRTKGDTSAQLTYPQGFVTAIQNLPEGGGGAAEKTVFYYDYTGEVVASYTPTEYAELSEHPANPTHTGLVAQGWNWTLSDAKAAVASAGFLDIGQNYVTSSGDTEIDVSLDDQRYLSPYLEFYYSRMDSFTISWGDGTSTEIINEEYSDGYILQRHDYAQTGNYTISIHSIPHSGIISPSIRFSSLNYKSSVLKTYNGENDYSESVYSQRITEIRLGEYYSLKTGSSQFNQCGMKRISIPSHCTEFTSGAFQYCDELLQVTVPPGNIFGGSGIFQNCRSLISVAIPKVCTTEFSSSAFYNCFNLKRIYVSSSSTVIGSTALYNCVSLKYINLRESMTLSTSSFAFCQSLESVDLKNISVNTGVFSDCLKLKNAYNVPTLTSSLFNNNYSLQNIVIPSNATEIPSSIFKDCHSLTSITIPQSVTAIDSNAFYKCYNLKEITILSNVLTTVASGAFNDTGLREINFPDSLTSIPNNNTFRDSIFLRKITLSNKVKTTGSYTFANCYSLSELYNYYGLAESATYSFYYCYSLPGYIISNLLKNRTQVYQYEFYHCENAAEIIIPASITTIGNNSFFITSKTIFHFRSTTPPTLSGSNVFSKSSNLYIYVPTGCKSTYILKSNWSALANYIYEEATVACTGITLDTAAETFTQIGDNKKITETITPSDCNQDIIYTSSDPKCVSVNNNGLIEAVDTGTCTITATCGTQTATCTVTSPGRTCSWKSYANMKVIIEDEGTESARLDLTTIGADQKYRAIGVESTATPPTGLKMIVGGTYPVWFSYSTSSISIHCDQSIKATFYFVDGYTGATGYESCPKYIGGDSGYDDPNVSKGDRTVSIPSGASGCAIQLYKEDGNITSAMVSDITVSIA